VGGREGLHDLDHLGHPVGDVGEAAREDVDVVAVAVDLDAGAVELVLDRGRPGNGEGRGGVGGGGREHREDGCSDREADLLQGVGAAGQREVGGLSEVAAEHDRPADRRDRNLGGLGDGIDEDPFEGAGPHLADEDSRDEQLFVGGGAPAEGPQRVLAQGGGAGTGCGEEVVEQVVEIGDGQARRLGRFAHEAGDGAVADADAALAGAPDEESDRRGDLLGWEATEQVGERLDLGQP
jgi:hypothetical protein